ncbi:MAG: Rab family GTPase [Promethearchaeota archaeon]
MFSFKFKIVLLGPAAVGKTSLLRRYVTGIFEENYSATIGVQFLTKELVVKSEKNEDLKINLSIWDVTGQERFEDLRTTFYRGAQGALLIFDLTRRKTFEEIKFWYEEITKVLGKEVPFVLIGNKNDLLKDVGRGVEISEAEKLAKEFNSIYIETSAKTGDNVDKAFLKLTELILSKEGIILKSTITKPVINLVIKNNIKKYIKLKGLNTSAKIFNENHLNNILTSILDRAILRAKQNGRKSVRAVDL